MTWLAVQRLWTPCKRGMSVERVQLLIPVEGKVKLVVCVREVAGEHAGGRSSRFRRT